MDEYSLRNIDVEIEVLIYGEAEGQPKAWTVNRVMADHCDIEGQDKDFALCAARYTVERRVEDAFRRLKANEKADVPEQDTLFPGYKRLQRRYIVEREDGAVPVRVEAMTNAEILGKANEHRAMAQGHSEHADELMRFLRLRQDVA